MRKALLSLLLASSTGTGVMTLLSAKLGGYTEAAALGIAGLALIAASQWLEPVHQPVVAATATGSSAGPS